MCFRILVGLATAENAWRSGQVYTYKHSDKVRIGFPEIEQPLTPSRLSCKVQLQPTTPNTVFAKVKSHIKVLANNFLFDFSFEFPGMHLPPLGVISNSLYFYFTKGFTSPPP